MLTSCEKMPLIIRAGMIAINNTAMLTSKYNMVLKFIAFYVTIQVKMRY